MKPFRQFYGETRAVKWGAWDGWHIHHVMRDIAEAMADYADKIAEREKDQ